MVALAQMGNVNFPLTAKIIPPGRWDVVEQIRRLNVVEIMTLVFGGVSTAGVLGAGILWLSGALASPTVIASDLANVKSQTAGIQSQIKDLPTQQDVALLNAKITALTTAVVQLQADFRLAPRADQVETLRTQLTEMRGYQSAMDARLRANEAEVAALRRAQELIDASSRANLKPR